MLWTMLFILPVFACSYVNRCRLDRKKRTKLISLVLRLLTCLRKVNFCAAAWAFIHTNLPKVLSALGNGFSFAICTPDNTSCTAQRVLRAEGDHVSDTDSFINEVSEEVRKDQLFGYVRKYGWIAATLIVVIVGGAAYTEWAKATDRAAAEATGDALLGALLEDDPAARADALAAVTIEGPAASVTGLLTASAQQDTGDLAAAKATLDDIAVNADVPQVYRDLAVFKSALIEVEGADPAARRQALEALTTPGLPYRLLAMEQLAIMDVAEGNTDTAVTGLRAVIEDAAVTRGLRDRAQTLMIALGEELEQTAAQ